MDREEPASSTFEGTARELMRVQIGTVSHPMGDMIFNPTAKPGSPDWRVMYMSVGEGAAENRAIFSSGIFHSAWIWCWERSCALFLISTCTRTPAR